MTTTLSSRGQVVLPRGVRSKLGLQPGARFDVSLDHGNVVLAPKAGRKIVRPKRDRKTGLPIFPVPANTPQLPAGFVRDVLADFP